MADNQALIEALLGSPPAAQEQQYPYGRPRFPNADPRAYFDIGSQEAFRNEGMGDRLSDLRTTLPWALMAMRAAPASTSMRPFNPNAPEAPLPQQPKPAMSDDGWGQHVYEALLGRKRMLGQAVAEPESGNVMRSPLFWLLSALGGYGSYKLWGLDKEPLPWENPQTRPDSYANRVATERAGRDATFDARQMDRALALQNKDIPAYNKIENPIFSEAPPYSEAAMKALARYRLPGGVGNEPY